MSISRLWVDRRLNRDAAANHDDWTDLSLALYVGRRDVVVSADRLVRTAFAVIDPTIPVVTAGDLRAKAKER